jgi:hypothetical protein
MENMFEIETLQDWQTETAADAVIVDSGGGCNNSNCNSGDEP